MASVRELALSAAVLTLAPADGLAQATVLDSDGDGILNDQDRCPDLAETLNGFDDNDGCPDSFDDLFDLSRRTVEEYWRITLPEVQAFYIPPVEVVRYDQTISTACGESEPNNAFYCPESRSLYFHEPFLLDEFERGDMVPVFIVAHEWGHLVQHQLGLLERNRLGIFTELQADCLSGAHARYLDDQGMLEEGDVLEARDALFRMGRSDVPWVHPQAHGSAGQRIDAFTWGFEFGGVACLESAFEASWGTSLLIDEEKLAPAGSMRELVPWPAVGEYQLMGCKSRHDLIGRGGITDALACRYRTRDGTNIFHELIALYSEEASLSLYAQNQDRLLQNGFMYVEGGDLITPFNEVVGSWQRLEKPWVEEVYLWRQGRLYFVSFGPPGEIKDFMDAYPW